MSNLIKFVFLCSFLTISNRVSAEKYSHPERTTRDVLIELLSYLDQEINSENITDNLKGIYQKENNTIKSIIMKHQLKYIEIKDYLDSLKSSPLGKLGETAGNLSAQLGENINPTKLWENFYGRVFDSAFINELVKNPPPEVQDAMTSMSIGIGELLERTTKNDATFKKRVEQGIYSLFTDIDPRFWFPKISEITDIIKYGSDGAVDRLIKYLKKPKTSGIELISVPYMVVKVGIKLKELGKNPKYMQEADKSYQELATMVTGIRINKDDIPTVGAGITLANQPLVIQEPWMTPSNRPTISRYPRTSEDPVGKGASRGATRALYSALEHGVVWASGMSGSTNIDLHAWHWLQNNPDEKIRKEIDKKAAFLGIIMFLIYDGGHSLAEPLWAAHIIDKKLGLNFNLSDTNRIEDFIPDFEKFIDIYDGTKLRKRVGMAFNKAFRTTINYFRMYSKHRNKFWKEKYPPKEVNLIFEE